MEQMVNAEKTGCAAPGKVPRILLCGVFGPFGVDDEYGRKENLMELYHNQVTRIQGPASLRFHHRSFGLYFIAANIDADTTILDFPSRKRFIREIQKGYDTIGISFITPNFSKAREMARLIRLHAPKSTIILGGHGAAIEGVEELIDCDHVVRGEGIRWMRKYLGQATDAPIVHPILPCSEYGSIFGIPIPGATPSVLVPGLGCVNGCHFCCTSHFFEKAYIPFYRTGKELFEQADRIAKIRRTKEFSIMDENVLKDTARATELLAEMEKRQRWFNFYISSSAEAIMAFGIDNMVRLGVCFVWIGFESQNTETLFTKNSGIDAAQLVHDLRDRGISVLGSTILCMEHHTPDNITADIECAVGLQTDFVQFMLYTGMPVTRLYKDHKERGLLNADVPFEEWHGQNMLNWHHPAFPNGAAKQWLDYAFRRDFEVNSSSIYRMIETAFRGYRRLEAMTSRDACLEARYRQLRERARTYSQLLPIIARHAVNDAERQRALALDAERRRILGPVSAKERFNRLSAKLLAARWDMRVRLLGDSIQPSTIVTRNRNSKVKVW
ncbi:MAG: cobalamin-dependent protein [Verrucomicrobia bacterium]|nr:cobalamin-dependent protein [Verrucomicrobiota bacterium]MBU1855681.1 cobalamin-dependent protein [Verrucomicrobiota bacterium]